MLCGGAYYGTKYYVYRLIVRDGNVAIRFSDLRLSLFPLGLEIRNIKDFPIIDENLVSFAGVNVYLPPASLFMRKKAISIEIDRPQFVLHDSLLRGRDRKQGPKSSFSIHRVRIRRGELHFRGRNIECRLLDFNLQSGNIMEALSFRIDSPHLKVTLPVGGEPLTLEGNLAGEARRHGTSWRINALTWQTREVSFHLNGRILDDGSFQLGVSAQGNPENILRPLLDELTVRGLMYAEVRIAGDAKRAVRVTADFSSPSCRILENRYANLTGRLRGGSASPVLELEAEVGTELGKAFVRLQGRGRETRVELRDLPAAHIAEILEIARDAPLAGMVRSGTIEFSPGFIRGHADLDAAPNQPLNLPFVPKGSIDFQRDKRARQTTFSGEHLQFSGGELSINGRIDSRARISEIHIDTTLKNLENIAPYADHYLDINLLPWKLSGGNGAIALTLTKHPGRKRITSRLRLSDFQANRQPIGTLQGEVQHTAPVTSGAFTIRAPDLSASAELAIADQRTTLRFRNVTGESGKIMRILGLNLALRGSIAGDFSYHAGKALPAPEVEGRFTAPRLALMGYDLSRVQGVLRSNLQGIDLQELTFDYKGGQAQAGVLIDFGLKRFDLHGRIRNIDAALLQPEFSGRGDIEFDGRGEFLKDPLTVSYQFRDMHYFADRPFGLNGTATILTDFSDFSLKASGEASHGGGPSPFAAEIGRSGKRLEGSFTFNLTNLDQLIPWRNNVGGMRLLGQIYSGADGSLHSRGVAVFSGRTLSLPSFSHTLDNFQGTVTFSDQAFSLQSLSGEMGGGKVEGGGLLVIDGGQLRSLIFNFKGKGLNIYPMDRTSCLVDPDLTLRYVDKQLLLSGTLNFQAVEWQREIDEPIVFSTRSELTTAESKIRELLRLDIAMNGENFQMRNSLGRIQGRFMLRLSGTASFPILKGTCEGRQGEIYLSDRPFNVLKAKLVFNNNYRIDPLIHVESEAFIQSYRIRFDIRGSTSRAQPELSASPPLPTQDILALVSLGEVFERTGSSEVSSQQGGTAMVTNKLTEEIKNRANKLLGINLLRIDPVLSDQSSLDTSRLTIGKTISKDLVVVYSTNLSTSRQEIFYLQYQLSPSISLIAMRNEEGRYSLDLRLRSRR